MSRLRAYQPTYFEINVAQLLEISGQILRKVQQVGPENVVKLAEELFGNLTDDEIADNSGLSLPKIKRVNS
jgi:hypothetical protein